MTIRIEEARNRAGITQKELAQKLGIATGTLSGYENGKHDPKSDYLGKIADICGVSVDFLLGRDEKEKTPIPTESEQGIKKVDPLDIYKMLISFGWLEEGRDLSSADLRFLRSIGSVVESWFSEGE